MIKEMNNGPIKSNQTLADIRKAKLEPRVTQWLEGEEPQITKILNIYAENPKTFGLHPDLEKEPRRILGTVLNSAETLFGYQQAYNPALQEVAKANGIVSEKIEEIPFELQESSVARETRRISSQLKSGGTVALGLMGSGASGKGTVAKRSGLERAVNTTTRLLRPGEEHGKDYYYLRVMHPEVSETLDIDTGVANGINYMDMHGPFVTTVHRPGRAFHATPLSEFQRLFVEQGQKVIFFEHGPIQVEEAARKLPELMPKAVVVPVCILPPSTGIVPLAMRIAARTYGDPTHQDQEVTKGYGIKESYLESTIGHGQIEELKMTAQFVKGKEPIGVAYIVNDKLEDAVKTLKGMIKGK